MPYRSNLQKLALAGLLLVALLIAAPIDPSGARSSDRAGQFDYYALVLSWSPSYCATRRHGRRDPQCESGRPYAFVMHGLWPQYKRGYPEFCRMKSRPWVPKKVISDMLDIMPSPGLIIHQYKKHGTCAGMSARAYFTQARQFFDKIIIPKRYVGPFETILVSPQEIEKDFLTANPKMNADMISVSCGRRGRLRELSICFSKEGELRACGVNENQKRLCKRSKIILPPVRDMRKYTPRPL